MKHSIQITKAGGPEVLKWIEEPSSELTPHTVRISVKASGVNFADVMMRMGLYPEAPKTPFVPGYEFAGKVLEVGEGVSHFKPGDRVLGFCPFGGYTTELVVSDQLIQKIPENLEFAQAAAIPVNFLTAWVSLMEMARVRKGDRVLIQSAAGGVGTAAVQIAAQEGASVVGLVGSEKKKKTVLDLGAKEVWLTSEWEAQAPKEKFDVILDSVGGKTLKLSYRSLKPMGRVVSFGISDTVGGKKRSLWKALRLLLQTPFFTPFQLMMTNRGVYGLNLLKFSQDVEALTPAYRAILERVARGQYHPLVGHTFPLEKAGDAQIYLQSRSNIGKVILTND